MQSISQLHARREVCQIVAKGFACLTGLRSKFPRLEWRQHVCRRPEMTTVVDVQASINRPIPFHHMLIAAQGMPDWLLGATTLHGVYGAGFLFSPRASPRLFNQQGKRCSSWWSVIYLLCIWSRREWVVSRKFSAGKVLISSTTRHHGRSPGGFSGCHLIFPSMFVKFNPVSQRN